MAKELTKEQKIAAVETEALLDEARSDPDFAAKMARQGYTEAIWAHGEQLLNDLLTLGHARAQAESDRFYATNHFHDLCDLTWEQTMPLVQNCKTLFQGRPDLLTILGLHQSRINGNGKSRFDYPDKTTRFDQRAPWQRNLFAVAQTDPEISAILPNYGYPLEYLAACAADVEAMFDANHAKERAAAAVTRAVSARDAAYERLLPWLRCTRRIADKVRQKKRRPRLPLHPET